MGRRRKYVVRRIRDPYDLIEQFGGFQPRNLTANGLSRFATQNFLVRLATHRVTHGIYSTSRAPDPIALACLRSRRWTISLSSAAWIHGLIRERPMPGWLAIGTKDNPPRDLPFVRCVRLRSRLLERDVERLPFLAGELRLFTVERTLIELVRFRSRVDQGSVLEALRRALWMKATSEEDLLSLAGQLGATRPVRALLKSMRGWSARVANPPEAEAKFPAGNPDLLVGRLQASRLRAMLCHPAFHAFNQARGLRTITLRSG